jgi:hypothetical protein
VTVGDRVEHSRAVLSERLQARRGEIEQTILTRIRTLAEAEGPLDPDYGTGLRAAVPAAIDYGLAGIQESDGRLPSVPVALLTQARVAARCGVSLDTVLRRYIAGYTLLSDFLIGEAEASGILRGAALQRLLRAQATLFDRVIAAVTEEYGREAGSHRAPTEQRRVERVQRLLAGELLDTSELLYDVEAFHLGTIASGEGGAEAIRDLAAVLDRRALIIPRGDETVWAWLGGRCGVDSEELERALGDSWPAGVALAVGESRQGLVGWRLTHQQAQAALPIALGNPHSPVRYSKVALLASMLQDDLLSTSLRELFLDPLSEERDGGEVLRETLRAYFTAERSASSAAAALGVNRHTVTNRLRTVEERIGRSLSTCSTEMDAALRLDGLGRHILPYRSLK